MGRIAKAYLNRGMTAKTKPMMDLRELVEKCGAADLLRGMIGFAAERTMKAEAEARTGAAKGARSPLCEVDRNGYHECGGDARAGQVTSDIPKFPQVRDGRKAGRFFTLAITLFGRRGQSRLCGRRNLNWLAVTYHDVPTQLLDRMLD